MMAIDIPGRESLCLDHLVLDVNGTLARDGVLLAGVAERLARLQGHLKVHLLSADTHGRLDEIACKLGVEATRLGPGQPEALQKREFVRTLGERKVVAVGNGANDVAMLAEAALGIAVLGPEGLAAAAMAAADVVVATIEDGLDLLLYPRRIVATLRQ